MATPVVASSYEASDAKGLRQRNLSATTNSEQERLREEDDLKKTHTKQVLIMQSADAYATAF